MGRSETRIGRGRSRAMFGIDDDPERITASGKASNRRSQSTPRYFRGDKFKLEVNAIHKQGKVKFETPINHHCLLGCKHIDFVYMQLWMLHSTDPRRSSFGTFKNRGATKEMADYLSPS